MKYLNYLIDKKFHLCFFVEKFNVKKFCKLHGYLYSALPKIQPNIRSIHEQMKNTRLFGKETIVVHIEYDKKIIDRDLKALLLDREIDHHFTVILTNNNKIDFSQEIKDICVQYKKTNIFSKLINRFTFLKKYFRFLNG